MSRFPISIGALAALLLTIAGDVTAGAREEATGTPAAEAASVIPLTGAAAVGTAQADGDGPAPGTTPAPAMPAAEAGAGTGDAPVQAEDVADASTGSEGPAEGSVEGRAQARWDALIAGDYEAAYELYSPGFREAVTFEAFRAQQQLRTVAWIEARVAGATCEEEEACTVRSTVTYSTNRPMRGVSHIESATSVTERWVRLGGAWYFVPDRLG